MHTVVNWRFQVYFKLIIMKRVSTYFAWNVSTAEDTRNNVKSYFCCFATNEIWITAWNGSNCEIFWPLSGCQLWSLGQFKKLFMSTNSTSLVFDYSLFRYGPLLSDLSRHFHCRFFACGILNLIFDNDSFLI